MALDNTEFDLEPLPSKRYNFIYQFIKIIIIPMIVMYFVQNTEEN